MLAPLPARAWWRPARAAALAVLVLAFVGLHVPPIRATADRYLYSAQPHKAVVRQSDADAIRAISGDEPIDVALGHFADNHVVLSELTAHGVPIRFRSPGWERSLMNWARVGGCPEPDLLLPKSRFSLVERNTYAPPGTERYVGRRLKLIEDRDAVTVMGVADAQEMIWDLEWRPGVWVGNTPTTFLIHNGTGRPQSVKLLGDTSAGPSHPDRDRRTLRYRLDDQTGKLSLPKENKAVLPLVLKPGLNRVELSVEEPASPTPPQARRWRCWRSATGASSRPPRDRRGILFRRVLPSRAGRLPSTPSVHPLHPLTTEAQYVHVHRRRSGRRRQRDRPHRPADRRQDRPGRASRSPTPWPPRAHGHSNLLAVVTPNLICKPATVMITKVTIKGAKQAVQMFGPAQAAVARAVADSVAEGVIPKDKADEYVIVCGVFIHWDAADDNKIYQYNYEATKLAIKSRHERRAEDRRDPRQEGQRQAPVQPEVGSVRSEE